MEQSQIVMVPVDNLHPNPDNPRKEAGDVTELANSIRQQGILQDIIVRPSPEFGVGHYVIEDGYRRWVAAKSVLTTVRVVVRPIHPHENLKIREIITSMITTIHRQDLGPLERAEAYARLRDEAGMNQQQIAKLLGLKGTESVGRYLSLLELSPSYKKSLQSGKVTVDKAMDVVKKQRSIARERKGQKPISVGWEPDHFTDKHPLAKSARALCDAREHTGRRRLGNVACGQCFETAIRRDQMNVDSVQYREAGFDVPFIPPMLSDFKEANGRQ